MRRRRGGRGGADWEEVDEESLVLDHSKAKALLVQWLQQKQRGSRPSDSLSLENCSRPRRRDDSSRTYTCNCWVWTPDAPGDGWSCFPGTPQGNRKDAGVEAFAAAVAALQIPVTKEFALTAEGKRKLEAKRSAGAAEERRRQLQEEQNAAALANALESLQPKVLAAFFPDALKPSSNCSGFRTPRENESEPLPEPLPPQLILPTPAEADRQDLQTSSQKGGKAAQTLQRVVAKESAGMLQGPTLVDADAFAGPNGKRFLSVCGLVVEGSLAILGTGVGPRRSAARSAAARAALSRLDTSPPLPTPDEAGDHAAVMANMRKLHQMHPFRVWAFQGSRPGPPAEASWHCTLWGRIPQGGRLRDFWGKGLGSCSAAAIAEASGMAAAQLTGLLGSPDAASWLRAMARVPMELDELPAELLQEVLAVTTTTTTSDSAISSIATSPVRHSAWRPPDLSQGPAEPAPQTYENPDESDLVEAQRTKRGVPHLPVRELREELGKNLEDEAVIVVSGGTGSGKSTQIPHYILSDFRPEAGEQDWRNKRRSAWVGPPRVVVTEPRRIAAVSLAERVAWERGESVGNSVGYSVRGDTRRPRAAGSIEFCTVGILLRRLQKDPGLQDISHVLIDEVHERDIMTDFLLILLKELLVSRTDLRVILMSATIDVASFCSYFWDCPCLEVPTGPRFDVKEIYLEDSDFEGFPQRPRLLEKEALARGEQEGANLGASGGAQEPDPEAEEGANEEDFLHKTGVWWGEEEKDDTLWELMALLVAKVALKESILSIEGGAGSILCFLPGWAEIKMVQDLLEDRNYKTGGRLWILALHSSLTKEDQQLIFTRPPEGRVKVILATNIAESSVTIDDVVVVVDSGLAREVAYDPVRHLSQLETVWVSQSSAIQRAGRAGRVRAGTCYRLFSRAQQEAVPWRSSPEMQRCELSSTCLSALALHRECRDFLGRAIDPPTKSAVESALQELIELGAVCQPPSQTPVNSGELLERMLPLGEVLARMPLSPTIGRMLIIGVLFHGVGIACLIAAVLTASRRPFVAPPGKRKESLACQCGFDATSDVLAAVQAVRHHESWRHWKGDRIADREAGDFFLVPKRLNALLSARNGMQEELVRAGVLPSSKKYSSGWEWGGQQQSGAGHEDVWRESWWTDDAVSDWWSPTSAEQASGWKPRGVDDIYANDDNIELARALLVAAFPSLVALRRRVNTVKHNTRSGLEAIVSPQSVNAPAKSNNQSAGLSREDANTPTWWAYGQMQIDTQKQGFLRQVTLVDPYHVVLFGGLTSLSDSNGALREVDGWIELRGGRKTREALGGLRAEINRSIHNAAVGKVMPEHSRQALDFAIEALSLAGPRLERAAKLLPEKPSVKPRPVDDSPSRNRRLERHS